MKSEATKEKIKLRATYVNNLAVGFFLAGFLAPTVGALTLDNSIEAKIAGLLCVCISVVLHMYATEYLSEIDR